MNNLAVNEFVVVPGSGHAVTFQAEVSGHRWVKWCDGGSITRGSGMPIRPPSFGASLRWVSSRFSWGLCSGLGQVVYVGTG